MYDDAEEHSVGTLSCTCHAFRFLAKKKAMGDKNRHTLPGFVSVCYSEKKVEKEGSGESDKF